MAIPWTIFFIPTLAEGAAETFILVTFWLDSTLTAIFFFFLSQVEKGNNGISPQHPLSSSKGLTLQETSRSSSDAESWEPSAVLHKQSGRTWLSSDILSKQAARQQISFRSRGPWWRESAWQEYVLWNDSAGAPRPHPFPAPTYICLILTLFLSDWNV